MSSKYSFDLTDVVTALTNEFGNSKVVKRTDGYSAPCVHPDHDDENPSMSVADKAGRIVVKCFAGCDQNELFQALLEFMSSHGFSAGPQIRTTDGSNPSRECTLEAYAEAKQLPIEFLDEIGVKEVKYKTRRRLEIPYSGSLIRYRESLTGKNNFKWKLGARPALYGLFNSDALKQSSTVVLVEGESDAQTLWLHGYTALGLPGASQWNDERDAGYFEQFDSVYVVLEPDTGGVALSKAMSASSISDRVLFVALEGASDVSELHIDDPDSFNRKFDAAIAAGRSVAEFEDSERTQIIEEAWTHCQDLAQEPRILDVLQADLIESGLVGELDNALILYLALTTRVFDRPTSVWFEPATFEL